MVRSNRIRSTYQRRVLDWLADGGGTVTEVSQALSIRVPHASAALKQLRESGDVVRDDASLRGSRYRLSSQGLNRLEADGLARLNELVRWPYLGRSQRGCYCFCGFPRADALLARGVLRCAVVVSTDTGGRSRD